MAKKTLYHQELVKMGDVQVLVDSDPIESTFKRGTKFVALKINGEERTYTPALVNCAEAFRGYKGQTLTVRATGSDYEGATDARIELFGAQAPQRQQQPPPQQQQRQPSNQTQQRAAGDTKMPIHGQTVGMAVNNACQYLMSQGQALTAENIWPIASGIVRISRYMEAGNLAPKPGKAAPAQTHAPAPPPQQPPPQQRQPEPEPDQPPLPEDDVPF